MKTPNENKEDETSQWLNRWSIDSVSFPHILEVSIIRIKAICTEIVHYGDLTCHCNRQKSSTVGESKDSQMHEEGLTRESGPMANEIDFVSTVWKHMAANIIFFLTKKKC